MITENVTSEATLHQELEVLSVSKRLVRSLSQKLKRKNQEDETSGVSLRCPTMYTRGGGCKVSATTNEEFCEMGCQRRSSSSVEEGKPYKPICGPDDTNVDCFSYGVKERFRKRSIRKVPEAEGVVDVFLPDDIVEMCLVRLPLTSLMKARLVCKKWRNLTTAPRFLQLRRNGLFQSPWMFLFGSVKDGFCSREIHAYDVSFNKWHKINSDVIKGRFLFSVVSIQENVYIIGGFSSLNNFGRLDRSSVKTHKGVLVFSPLTNSWHKVASMKHARSKPVLGVYEVNSDSLTIKSQHSRDRRLVRTRVGGVSDVYEDPHRLSVRRQLRYSFDETEASFKPKNENPSRKDSRRFLIMAAGGVGSWDEPLDSCEIYDSLTNKWTEIQRLPVDFGVICSGTFCNGMFYGYSETDNLAAYNIERGYWVRIHSTSLPARVHEYHPKIISCENRLFMVSVSWCEGDGQIGRRNKAVRKIWELDLVYFNWEEISTHPDAPMDWNAMFVGDKNMIFGVEMFKIFGQVLDFMTMFNVSNVRKKWVHVSKNRVAHELDASSCVTKTVAFVHL
ncbi:F-box/kelch-repeat protein At5g42360-like [Bidens hawaiensis]|uniref:F-box/kelch-repeat protein At5g42360-like n=1 Tax=Bidens hawaiensis TaxID=980011 RepID=UPI00404B530B